MESNAVVMAVFSMMLLACMCGAVVALSNLLGYLCCCVHAFVSAFLDALRR